MGFGNFIERNWTQFKALIDSTNLQWQYEDSDSVYELIGVQGLLVYICSLVKDGGADHLDFENNYQELAHAELRVDTASSAAAKTIEATFTASGSSVAEDLSASPLGYFSVQVTGTGAAPTLWSVDLQVSLDNVNFTTILTHDNTDGNGRTISNVLKTSARYIKFVVTSLTLGSATNIKVLVTGTP